MFEYWVDKINNTPLWWNIKLLTNRMHTHTWTQTYLLISLGISVHEKEEKSFEHVTSVLMIFPNSIEFVCLFRLSICFRFLGHIVIIRIVFVNFDTIRNCVYTQYTVHSILDIANFPFINISSAVQRTDLFFIAAIRSGAFTMKSNMM